MLCTLLRSPLLASHSGDTAIGFDARWTESPVFLSTALDHLLSVSDGTSDPSSETRSTRTPS